MPLRQGRAWRDDGYHLDTIISTHALIHTGMTYTAGLAGDDVANNAFIEITFLVGSTYECHLEVSYGSEGKALLELFESRTVAGGGAMTPRNKNRSLTRSAVGATAGAEVSIATLDALCQETLTSNPVTSTGGTTLQSQVLISSGAGASTTPATGGGRAEWILCPGVQYSIRLTNTAGSAKDLALGLEWYEHPRNSQQAPEVL